MKDNIHALCALLSLQIQLIFGSTTLVLDVWSIDVYETDTFQLIRTVTYLKIAPMMW